MLIYYSNISHISHEGLGFQIRIYSHFCYPFSPILPISFGIRSSSNLLTYSGIDWSFVLPKKILLTAYPFDHKLNLVFALHSSTHRFYQYQSTSMREAFSFQATSFCLSTIPPKSTLIWILVYQKEGTYTLFCD